MSALLDPPYVRAPDFGPGEWLNAESPLTIDALRGSVVLVDFWDYTCVNCIRTLPYVTAWHDRYHDKGLVVIGVHAPEFAFARSRRQIEGALDEFGLTYPVLLDNDYATWNYFANHAWPAKYLIDAKGYIRFQRHGEGYYQETERAIQNLLALRDADVQLPPLMEVLRPEDQPGAVCYLPTPELHAGYEYGALGNPEGYASSTPMIYEMPMPAQRRDGHFYAEGIWQAGPSTFAFAGQDGGRVVLPYHAAGVNAVLSPSGDPVEVMLDLKTDEEAFVEVRQDGAPLVPPFAGSDVHIQPDGASVVRVERPRMVELVNNPTFGEHELELVFRANGLALYAFTFTSCVAPQATSGKKGTFTAR
jgi:thiol-disulfide isomerase/thioredoxin